MRYLTIGNQRIWVCFFMLAFHASINSNLINYVYSDFKLAPQVSTAYILSSVINGVLKLPLAKTLHLWGRAEALLVSTAVYILGMIILASCNGASAFAAGYVLYMIGYSCVYLVLDIFVADTSGLRSRAFAFAFASTPFICTAFTGPLAATAIRKLCGWRWGYGMFCIIQPAVICPLALVFKFYEWKAVKIGVWERQESGRTKMQSILHYIHEFDSKSILFSIAWDLNTNSLQSLVHLFLWPPGCSFYCHLAWHSMDARNIIAQASLRSSSWEALCLLCSLPGKNGAPDLTLSSTIWYDSLQFSEPVFAPLFFTSASTSGISTSTTLS